MIKKNMSGKLLIAALAQAERSDPSVKGIALLHIARVMAAEDRARAEQLMEAGIRVITSLPEKHRSILLNEAAPLAGTVSPQRAFDLIPMTEPTPWRTDRVIVDFLSHGHVKEAVDYLSEPRKEWDYPYFGAFDAMGRCRHDPAAQLRILRGAVKATLSGGRPYPMADTEFLRLFKWHWKILPVDEAAAAVRGLLERILQEPDQRGSMNSGGGVAGPVSFSSTQQWRLFEIFGPLRATAPELAESLLQRFDQLAEAVKKYPHGFDERQPQDPAAPIQENAPKAGVDIEWDDVNFKWIPVSEWVERILPQKFEKALELYRYDTTPTPNTAPRECWPSTRALRAVLHPAARYEGAAAVRHLDRIPDPDVRLLAQIGLCAAWAGLNQIGGASIPRQAAEPEKRAQPSLPMVTAESVAWKEQRCPHRVQVETSQWIAEEQAWAPAVRALSAVYRSDGQVVQMQRRNPDGSMIECKFDYDADGKPTAIWTLLDSGMVEQTAYSYDDAERTVRIAKNTPAPEATATAPVFEEAGFTVSSSWVSVSVGEDSYEIAEAAAILTKYDSQNRPVEVSYFGPRQQLLARKTLRWDSDGRLAGDELALTFGDHFEADSMPHWKTTYHYDSESRRVERLRSLGPNFEVRTTSAYDDHGNVAELIDSGKPATGLRHIRYEYRYDNRGNWIERVMLNPSDSGLEPQLKETRHIEY